ncbi:hypothetical protein RP20_CCG006961 [Aedes albopictus]|nr:hypothetical protein RP20_CCG006961 [Aedes albopictus]
MTAFHIYTNNSVRQSDEILSVKYEDGRWSKPYYDCGGGNIWMLTYTVPFFGYENGTYFFNGGGGELAFGVSFVANLAVLVWRI